MVSALLLTCKQVMECKWICYEVDSVLTGKRQNEANSGLHGNNYMWLVDDTTFTHHFELSLTDIQIHSHE